MYFQLQPCMFMYIISTHSFNWCCLLSLKSDMKVLETICMRTLPHFQPGTQGVEGVFLLSEAPHVAL